MNRLMYEQLNEQYKCNVQKNHEISRVFIQGFGNLSLIYAYTLQYHNIIIIKYQQMT